MYQFLFGGLEAEGGSIKCFYLEFDAPYHIFIWFAFFTLLCVHDWASFFFLPGLSKIIISETKLISHTFEYFVTLEFKL